MRAALERPAGQVRPAGQPVGKLFAAPFSEKGAIDRGGAAGGCTALLGAEHAEHAVLPALTCRH